MSFKRTAVAATFILPAVFSSTVSATNGLYMEGYGAKSRAMGGVGIGYTQDAIGFHMNPAGINELDVSTMQVDVDAVLLVPRRSVVIPDNRPPPNAGNPVEYVSGANLYAIPNMAGVYRFNRKLTMGFSFVGAGGGGTRYTRLAPNGFNFFNPVGRTDVGNTLGVAYLNGQMSMGVAYKLNKQHSLGGAIVGSFSQFKAFGLGVFKPFSTAPDYLTNNGNDYNIGYGLRAGWKWNPKKWLGIGVTAQTKFYHNAFDKYRGLFPDGGVMDLPAQFGVGFVVRPTDKIDVAFDVMHVLYSEVEAIGSPIERLSDSDGFLGDNNGAGFGWDDQTVYKLGMKYKVKADLDLSIGVNYGDAPMPSDQLLFSTLAPAVTEWHLGLGATYRPSKNTEWSIAYLHAFENTESGVANSGGQFDTFFPDDTATGPGNMELQMEQDSVEVSFSYKL